MISNVNFTGREGMLYQTMKPSIQRNTSYVSPYSEIRNLFTNIKLADKPKETDNAAAAASYVISHGTPKSAIVGINVDTIVDTIV
ncbi:hypothetical protein J6E39_06500 [bacterium]|nr:hypothetical protein [bacterium]